MAFEILMPQLGLTMEEGTVSRWLKQEGDTVKTGEEWRVSVTEFCSKLSPRRGKTFP